MKEATRLLIAYDGSLSAATAVRAAASLFRDARAHIATVPPETTLPADLTVFPATSASAFQTRIDELRSQARRAADDGSDGATRALRTVGRLMTGRAAAVVHAWQPVQHRDLTAHALSAGGSVDGPSEIVAALRERPADRAAELTEAGVAVARAAGPDAVGEPVESDDGAWRAVAATARAHGAAVIVMGRRGLGTARAALLGSVSSGLVHNAEAPVLVVPA